MSSSRRTVLRVLDDAEAKLVEESRHPAVMEIPNEDLQKLRRSLRERRDRARDIANRRRRDMRGKSKGGERKIVTDDTGSREKLSILSGALQRVNQEHSRRERFEARDELKRNAERALELRRAAQGIRRPISRRADKGMRSIPNEKAEDLVNRMEVGRVSQFVRDSQAKRDAR